MYKIILVWMLLMMQWSFGQGVWTKTFKYDAGQSGFNEIVPAGTGEYLLSGSISKGIRVGDLLLLKINEAGAVVWEKTIIDGGIATETKVTSDGGYVVVGTRYDKTQGYNQLFIKLDKNGTEGWSKEIDNENGSDKLYGVGELADGSFMAAGRTENILSVLLIAGNGSIKWNKTYGKGIGYDLVPAWDGGGVIVGSHHPGSSYWKVNNDGALEYERFIPGAGDNADMGGTEIAWSVSLTDDSAYITTGKRFPGGSNQYNKHDVGLTKYDVDGREVWHSKFGKSWASHDEGKAVIQTSDGGYVIAGRTKADNIAADKLWLIKTDSEGKLEWDKTSSVMSHGNGIVQTSDGGYIIIGPRGVIAKTNSAGQFEGEAGGVPHRFAHKGYSVNQKGRLMTVTVPALKGKIGNTLSLLDLKGRLLGKTGFTEAHASWQIPQGLSGVIVLKFNLGRESFTDRVHLLP